MKVVITAATAAFALAVAPAAWAQSDTSAPAAPAAPVVNYVSPCPAPKLEPAPTVPNPATVKPSESAKANRDYTAWHAGVRAFTACKKTELDGLQEEIKAAQAKSPFGAKIAEYNSIFTPYEKAVADYKAAGFTLPGLDPKKLKKPGSCPPAPPAAEAPIPAFTAATAKKSQIAKAEKEFGKYMHPRQIYLHCVEQELRASGSELDASVAPTKAKYDAAFADYKAVADKAKVIEDRWNAFAKAYNDRLKAAGGN